MCWLQHGATLIKSSVDGCSVCTVTAKGLCNGAHSARSSGGISLPVMKPLIAD